MIATAIARSLRTAVQVVLQDDCRRRRGRFCLPCSPVLILQGQPAFSLAARKPLVLQGHGKRRLRTEGSGKLLDARSHLGWCAIESSWQADNDRAHSVLFAGKASDFPRNDI